MRSIAVVCGLALVFGCYKDEHHSPTDPVYAGAMTLSTSVSSIPADGFSRVTITATLKPDTASNKRAIAFTTTAGTFVGAASPGKTTTVTADFSGAATVELRSSTDVETALVTATDGGVTHTVNIPFTPVTTADIVRISTSKSSVPADGASVIQVIADIAPGLQGTQRSVTFTTSVGKFVDGGGTTVTATAGVDNRAVVDLQAPDTPTIARVAASANGAKAETSVTCIAALPERVEVDVKFSIAANEDATVTAKLSRTIGKVTKDRVVTWSAVDNDGKAIGVFHNVHVSAADETATTLFTPNGTAYRGPITIKASTPSASGGIASGEARAVITN
jgi:hypothetical protein